MHDIWIDPVWSKVIATFIWAILVGLIPLILGWRRAHSYPLFQLLATRIPAWYYLVSLLVLLLLQLSFPDRMLLGCILLSAVSIVVAAVMFRRQQNWAKVGERAVQQQGAELVFSSAEAELYSLRSSLEQRWEHHQPVGDRATGSFQFDQEKVISISRTNRDGRFVVHIDRYQGSSSHRVERKSSAMSNRVVQIAFEAQVTSGSHDLLFVAKKMNGDWVHNGFKSLVVDAKSWHPYSGHFSVPNTEDFVLFYEDGKVTAAPSTLQIRNLTIQVINQ